jgi:phospholipid transport system transporter-binding protein
VIKREGERLLLSGPLTLETVKSLYDEGLQSSGKTSLTVDMSGVEAVDSSAVSLLLVWLREAKHSNVNLHFSHVPDNLLVLASLYGVADLIPMNPGVSA